MLAVRPTVCADCHRTYTKRFSGPLRSAVCFSLSHLESSLRRSRRKRPTPPALRREHNMVKLSALPAVAVSVRRLVKLCLVKFR